MKGALPFLGLCLFSVGCSMTDPSTVDVWRSPNPEDPLLDPIQVDELPKETEDGYSMISDYAFFDLRQWKPPTPGRSRTSPVILTNEMTMKLDRPLKTITFHYSTQGSGIDLQCLTHPYRVKQQHISGIHEGEREFAITFDVSNQKPDKPFKLEVRGIYWDGCKDAIEQVATYTLSSLESDSLKLAAAFPEGYLPTWTAPYEATEDEKKQGVVRPYRQLFEHAEEKDFAVGPDKRWVRWTIRNRKPDTHYFLRWQWNPKPHEARAAGDRKPTSAESQE